MRRIVRVALALLAVSTVARSEDQPGPDPEAVDRVLAEWQAKASAINSVDVRFRMSDDLRSWGNTRRVGRLILQSPNRALLETYAVADDGKAGELKDRILWDGRTILQFDPEERRVLRFPLKDEWPSAPGPLRLPFFFRMTVDEAKRDHDWAVAREDSGHVILKASQKQAPGPMRARSDQFIFLDRKTYLPTKVTVHDREQGSRQTYEVVEIKVNPTERLDELFEPCLDAWAVKDCDSWLTRLFLK